jgi:hypothetical protein
MDNIYPTEEDLEFIETYDSIRNDPMVLIEYIRGLWPWSHYFVLEGNKLELHCGGWSGAEQIIDSLTKNMFWHLYWLKSERGGHHYFEIYKIGEKHKNANTKQISL